MNDGGAGMIGKGLQQAGNALFEIQAKEQEKVDEARIQEKYSILTKSVNESIYGKAGVTSALGSAAVGVADKWDVDFAKISGEIAADLTPRQQQMFNKYAQTLRRGAYDNVLRHESAQVKAYEDQSYKELIENSMDGAATAYRDGTMIGIQTGIAIDAMRKRPEYAGASADVKAGMERDLRAGFHFAVVNQAITAGDTAYANEYFDSVRKDMPLKVRSQVEKMLKPATDFAEGRDLALGVHDKIAKGEMTVSEGERYILEKAKTKESAAVAQSTMREMYDAQRREADKLSGSFVEKFEMRPTRGTMNQIIGTREFQQMEPEKRAGLLKYMRSEVEQADDKFRSRQNEATPDKFMRYMEILEDPKFAVMDPNEIRAKQPELGRELTTKLLAAQKELKSTAGKFQIDKDLLNAAIPPDLLKSSNKDKLNAFRGIVESELQQWKIQNPGKVPTLEEQKVIARSANQEYIVIKNWWPDSTVGLYDVKPGSNAVPKDFYEWSVKEAKARGKNITDDDILKAWQKQKAKK